MTLITQEIQGKRVIKKFGKSSSLIYFYTKKLPFDTLWVFYDLIICYFSNRSLNQPLLSLSEYIKIQPPNIPIRKLEKYFSNYKLDHEQRKIETFFYEHKNEEWFLERYSPEFAGQLETHFTTQTKKSFEQFCADFEEKHFADIDLTISPELINLFKRQNKTNLHFNGHVDLPEKMNITRAPLFGFDPNSLTLFIKAVPKNVSRKALLDIFEKLPGFASLSLSDPLRSHDFVRYGWAAFRKEDMCAEGFLLAQQALQAELDLSLMRSKTAKRYFRVVPDFRLTHLTENLVLSAELIRLLDFLSGLKDNPLIPDQYISSDWSDCSESSNIGDEDELNDALLRSVNLDQLFREKQISPLKQFDLQISYLRKVHYFCFFSVTRFNDERKLSAKSGCAFLRPKLDLSKALKVDPLVDDQKAAIQSIFSKTVDLNQIMTAQDILGLARQNIKKQTIITDWFFKVKVLLSKQILDLAKKVKASPGVGPEKPFSQHNLEQTQAQITEKVSKKVESKLKELSKNLWPCPFCEKCFKTSEFVLKHFHKKHQKQQQAIQKNVIRKMMMRNYTTDDSKIIVFHETKPVGGKLTRGPRFVTGP